MADNGGGFDMALVQRTSIAVGTVVGVFVILIGVSLIWCPGWLRRRRARQEQLAIEQQIALEEGVGGDGPPKYDESQAIADAQSTNQLPPGFQQTATTTPSTTAPHTPPASTTAATAPATTGTHVTSDEVAPAPGTETTAATAKPAV